MCNVKPEGYKNRKAFINHNIQQHPEAQRFQERLNADIDDIDYQDESEEEEEEEWIYSLFLWLDLSATKSQM